MSNTEAIPAPRTLKPSFRFAALSLNRDQCMTLAGVALFFVIWTLGHFLIGHYLPPPWTVIAAAAGNLFDSHYFSAIGLPPGGYWPHLVSTTATALSGCVVGAAIGTLTGLGSAHSQVLHQITRPIAAILGTVPILVAAPFFLIWFGVSEAAKVILVAFYSAVVLRLYALRAVENLPPAFGEYARTLGAGPRMIFRRVSMPGAVPELFGGLRAALGAAWGLAAITELLGTDRGIGRVIITTWGVQDLVSMMAGLFLLSLIALAADALLMLARRYVTRWMPDSAV